MGLLLLLGNQTEAGITGQLSASSYSVNTGDVVTFTFRDDSISGSLVASDYSVNTGDLVSLEFTPVANTYQWLNADGSDIVGETGLTYDWTADENGQPKIRVTNPDTGKSRIFRAPPITVTPAFAISNTNPTEGDLVTFSGNEGQLYKDGKWVAGAALSYSRRVGTVDSGSYVRGAATPIEMTVSPSYILSDDFDGTTAHLGGSLLFNLGFNWGQNGWRTSQAIGDGQYVEYTYTELTPNLVIGVSSETAVPLPDMDCGVQRTGSSELTIFVNGSATTTVALMSNVGTILRFTRSGTSIVLTVDGVEAYTFTGVTVPIYGWAVAGAYDAAIGVDVGAINGEQPIEGSNSNVTFTPFVGDIDAVSTDWTDFIGSPDLTGGKYNLDFDALGSSRKYLIKTFSDNNVRFAFKVHNLLTSSIFTLFDLTDANGDSILSCKLQYASPTNVIRFYPGSAGFSTGGEYIINYTPSVAQVPILWSDEVNIEIRWDATTKSCYAYLDDLLCFSVCNATIDSSPATSLKIGKISNAEVCTGTVTISNMRIKEGQYIASQPIWANTRIAGGHGFGQSNNGGVYPFYQWQADYVGKYIYIHGAEGLSAEGVLGIATVPEYGKMELPLLQHITLPATFLPLINSTGVGGTSFSTGHWDIGQVHRISSVSTAATIANAVEEYYPLFILFQGFESDAGVYTNEVYKSKLASLIADIRTAMGSDTPLSIGGLSPFVLTGAGVTADYLLIDQGNQETAAEITNTAYASSIQPYSVQYEDLHFNEYGVLEMGGSRHAAAYLTLNPAAVDTRLGGTLVLSSTGWGTNGWRSAEALNDGDYVEWSWADEVQTVIFGTDSSTASLQTYTDTDCGLQWINNTTLVAYTNGVADVLTVSVVPNDILRFERSGTSILLKLNGSTIYTWTGVTMPQYAWCISSVNGIARIGQINGVSPTEGGATQVHYLPWIVE